MCSNRSYLTGSVVVAVVDHGEKKPRLITIPGSEFGLEEGSSAPGAGLYIAFGSYLEDPEDFAVRFNDDGRPPSIQDIEDSRYTSVTVIESTLKHKDLP